MRTTRTRNRNATRWWIAGAALLVACVSPAAEPVSTAIRSATAAQPEPTDVGTPPSAAASSAAAGSLVQAVAGGLSKTLHPYPDSASYSPAWLDAAALIWGGADGGGSLLAFDWDTLDYRPAMAIEMPQVSSDARTYTFTLRGDLKWSDGSAITMDDFLFAFDQASRSENHYVQLDLVLEIARYRAPTAGLIEVTLKDARPRDLALAIVNSIKPVPKKVWEGQSWTDPTSNTEIMHPSVVLGPFALEDASSADHASFVGLDTYYGGKPSVPRVELVAVQDPVAAYAALTRGSANWVHSLAPTLYQQAKANPGLDVEEWTPANAAYRTIEFNLNRPVLADMRVRQALAAAINRTDLITRAEGGLAAPQLSFIQPTNQRWVNSAVDSYDFDLARARRLLEDAGYQLVGLSLKGKDGQPVRLQVVYPTSSPARTAIATYVQQQWAELGIGVDLSGLDFNAYTDRVQGHRDFDVSLASYGGGSLDPDLGPKAQLITNGQQNVTGYSNPQVDDLFRQAASELDDVRRKQLYDQIQVLVNVDLPSHYLYALKSVDAFSTRVHGVVTHNADRLDVNDALLSWSVDQ